MPLYAWRVLCVWILRINVECTKCCNAHEAGYTEGVGSRQVEQVMLPTANRLGRSEHDVRRQKIFKAHVRFRKGPAVEMLM